MGLGTISNGVKAAFSRRRNSSFEVLIRFMKYQYEGELWRRTRRSIWKK